MEIGMNNFVNAGADEALLKSLADDERYQDSEELAKAMNKAGKVQVERQVNRQGKMFTQHFWVNSSDVKPTDKVIGGQQGGQGAPDKGDSVEAHWQKKIDAGDFTDEQKQLLQYAVKERSAGIMTKDGSKPTTAKDWDEIQYAQSQGWTYHSATDIMNAGKWPDGTSTKDDTTPAASASASGKKLDKAAAKAKTQSFSASKKTSAERQAFMATVRANGISWTETNTDGQPATEAVSWMRCLMAMNKHFANGGDFDPDASTQDVKADSEATNTETFEAGTLKSDGQLVAGEGYSLSDLVEEVTDMGMFDFREAIDPDLETALSGGYPHMESWNMEDMDIMSATVDGDTIHMEAVANITIDNDDGSSDHEERTIKFDAPYMPVVHAAAEKLESDISSDGLKDCEVGEDGIRIGDDFYWFNHDNASQYFKGSWQSAQDGDDSDIDDEHPVKVSDVVAAYEAHKAKGKATTVGDYTYYQHSYTKKWYVTSKDGKTMKEFDNEDDAKGFISQHTATPKKQPKIFTEDGSITNVTGGGSRGQMMIYRKGAKRYIMLQSTKKDGSWGKPSKTEIGSSETPEQALQRMQDNNPNRQWRFDPDSMEDDTSGSGVLKEVKTSVHTKSGKYRSGKNRGKSYTNTWATWDDDPTGGLLSARMYNDYGDWVLEPDFDGLTDDQYCKKAGITHEQLDQILDTMEDKLRAAKNLPPRS